MNLLLFVALFSGGALGPVPVTQITVLREFAQLDTTPVVRSLAPDVFVQVLDTTPLVLGIK